MYTREQDIAYVRGTLARLHRTAERDSRKDAIGLIDALMDYLSAYVGDDVAAGRTAGSRPPREGPRGVADANGGGASNAGTR